MALRPSHLLAGLLVAATLTTAHAAELGEARVLSHIGQALVADVELNLVEDGDNPVRVRLASADVYRGANIAMPAVLAGLNMTVMRRDGRQFLHLTSLKPVEQRYLHVYLELADGGQRTVRLVTLWLTPDPTPAPAPVPAAVPAAAPLMPAASALDAPGNRARTLTPVARPDAALQAGEEYVEAPAGARAAPAARPRTRYKAVPSAVAAAPVRKPAAPARSAHVAQHGAPHCPAPTGQAELDACTVLGEKNKALHQQLGQLEEKVKLLQGSMQTAPGAAATAAASVSAASGTASAAASAAASAPVAGAAGEAASAEAGAAASAASAPQAAAAAATASATASVTAAAPEAAPEKNPPKGAPRIVRKPKKVEPPEEPLPWLLIGGALAAVAALGALAFVLLRRRRNASLGKIAPEHKPAKLLPEGAPEAAPKPSFMAAVKARLMPGRNNPAPAAAAAPAVAAAEEPVLTDVLTQPE